MNKSANHHGDLANALLSAALEAVERGGAEVVSLREIAAELGVSRAAPYRHFVDRDDLLAAVAASGFDDLTVVYENALSGDGDGLKRLRQVLDGYMSFATLRSGLHKLMFESDLLQRTPPATALVSSASRAYELLWRAVEGANPAAGKTWVRARTATMMSTIVGFLTLDRIGRFRPFMIEPLTHDDLVEAVLRAAIGPPPTSEG